MTIYIVTHSNEYGDNTIVEGVFSTEEKAKEAIVSYKAGYDHPNDVNWRILNRALDKVNL